MPSRRPRSQSSTARASSEMGTSVTRPLERRELLSLTPIPASVNFMAGVSPSTPVRIGSILDSNTAAVAGDFTATINWGDGHISSGTVTASTTTGLFVVSGTNLYATSGSYPIVISVQDNLGDGAGINSTALVTNPTLTPIGTTVNFTAGVLPSTAETAGSFFDSDTTATASNFTASINWGDGNVSPGTVTQSSTNPSLFLVSGTNVYASQGTYTITISVKDQGGNSTTIKSTALVNTNQVYGFTGGLANLIVNGPLAANGYTNTNRPTFSGTSAPFAIVQLYARYLNADAELPLGEAVASANGQWTLTTGPLATGIIVVTAAVTVPGGYPSAMMTLINQNGTDLVYIDLAPSSAKRPPHRRVEAPHPKIHTSKPAMLKLHGPRHL